MENKNTDLLSPAEKKVQEKLDALVEKFNERNKWSKRSTQFLNESLAVISEIKHFIAFSEEFLGVDVDFFHKIGNQYNAGEIVDCCVIPKSKEQDFDEREEW